MLTFLVAVVFGIHLLCVNVGSAGPLLAVWFDWREGRGDALAGRAGRYLSAWALALLIPGGLLGLIVGWLLWSPAYGQVLQRLPSKIQFGIAEIVFSLVLMALHLWWWKARPQCAGWQRGLRMFIALLAATNLLYHFPVLFAIIEGLATSGEPSTEVLTSAQFRALLRDPQTLSRVAHFLLAAIATCGVMLLGLSLRMKRQKEAEADCERVAIWGGRIALGATLLQIPVGLWLTASLPSSLQGSVMGGDMVTSLLFLISLAAAFWLMHLLSAIAMGDVQRAKLVQAMAILVVIVMLMSGVLQRLRATALAQLSPAVQASVERSQLP